MCISSAFGTAGTDIEWTCK